MKMEDTRYKSPEIEIINIEVEQSLLITSLTNDSTNDFTL